MNARTGAERLARHSRAVTLGGLVILALLAWVYLLSGAGMAPMAGMAAAPSFVLVAAMWWAMMVAMMVPSAAPAILLYGQVHRYSNPDAPPTAAFLAGYLACWLGISLLAGWLQLAVTSPMTMALDSRTLAGVVLIVAGLYQLSPFKHACLARCRSPAQFITRHYRPGARGAARLGLIHGAYCVGCCWLLMALLFVVGVMNLAWVAALTLLVAAEKLLPGGQWIARIAGGALAVWGIVLLAA